LEALAKILGDAYTGSELGRLLARAGLPDPNPTGTKWRRLLEIFQALQNQYRVGDHVGSFLQVAMEPAQWHDRPGAFEATRDALNRTLAFSGLSIGEDGRLGRVAVARTLGQAEERAGRLRSALERRGVHADVLRFCRAELLQENYFHAVLEASKSVATKLREKSGYGSDGAELVDDALGGSPERLPRLAFNALTTQTHWSEQRGLMNLLKGVFGTFRNPTAHVGRIEWPISEQDALDLLTLASLLHRRLDEAVPTGTQPTAPDLANRTPHTEPPREALSPPTKDTLPGSI
jgi:uncharacterized protein (TIGR02391 family)